MKMKINKKLALLYVLFYILVIPPFVMAAATPPAPPSPGIISKTPLQFVTDTVFTILQITWIIAIGFIVIMFAMAGFKYLTAQGDPSKISEANRAVIWSTAGVAVVILAWSIITILRIEFNV